METAKIIYISVRPSSSAPVNELTNVLAIVDKGLDGDRYNRCGNRQVTLIEEESLVQIALRMNMEKIEPSLTRRNIVVKGFSLLSLKDKTFRLGEAILKYTGECVPCNKMNKIIGPGACNAMKDLGGITAKIISTGLISVGDTIEIYDV